MTNRTREDRIRDALGWRDGDVEFSVPGTRRRTARDVDYDARVQSRKRRRLAVITRLQRD